MNRKEKEMKKNELVEVPPGTRVEKDINGRPRAGTVFEDVCSLCGEGEVLVMFDGHNCVSRVKVADLKII